MTILIVGAGLVGSQVARLEIERGERPVVMDVFPRNDGLSDIFDISKAKIIQGDILNPHEIYQIIRTEDISAIIHTAANPMLTSGAQENPSRAVRINIMGTTNLLEASRIFSIKRFVFTSSNVIDHQTKPFADGRTRPSSIYGTTKLACECLGLNYSDFCSLEFVVLRFAAVFGPWRYGGGGRPTQTIRSLLQKALRGDVANISSEKLEFLYSKDAARACVLACHKQPLKQGIFNIGMNRIYDSTEIMTIVKEKIPSAKVQESDTPISSISASNFSLMSCRNSKEELGFEPEYYMEEAIDDYVNWLRERM